jgi:hypothetical protein
MGQSGPNSEIPPAAEPPAAQPPFCLGSNTKVSLFYIQVVLFLLDFVYNGEN